MKDIIRFLENRPFITFLPFLVLYCLFVACSSYKFDIGDAPRYLQYADNLLHPPPKKGIFFDETVLG